MLILYYLKSPHSLIKVLSVAKHHIEYINGFLFYASFQACIKTLLYFIWCHCVQNHLDLGCIAEFFPWNFICLCDWCPYTGGSIWNSTASEKNSWMIFYWLSFELYQWRVQNLMSLGAFMAVCVSWGHMEADNLNGLAMLRTQAYLSNTHNALLLMLIWSWQKHLPVYPVLFYLSRFCVWLFMSHLYVCESLPDILTYNLIAILWYILKYMIACQFYFI